MDPGLKPTSEGETLPEELIPRLGQLLLQQDLITSQALEEALAYQQSRRAEGEHILLGQALLKLGLVGQQALDQAIAQQLVRLHQALKESNRQLEQRVQARTRDLERRVVQIRTAADVTQMAISTNSVKSLLRRTATLIVERFGYLLVSIFLIDEAQEFANLVEVAGSAEEQVLGQGIKIAVGSRSMVGWVAANNEARVASDAEEEFYYMKVDLLPDTRSEVTIPVSLGDRVLGVLDVQHSFPQAFDNDAVMVLQTIANHIASVLQNFRQLEETQATLRELVIINSATHQISRAERQEEVLQALWDFLRTSDFPHLGIRIQAGTAQVVTKDVRTGGKLPRDGAWQTMRVNEIEPLLAAGSAATVLNLEEEVVFPEELLIALKNASWRGLALIPVRRSDSLQAVLTIGSQQTGQLNIETLKSAISLAELASSTLQILYTRESIERRLAALHTLNTVSQVISIETDLRNLYHVIHREVIRLMGEVDFFIATYDPTIDSIEIPFLYEGNQLRSLEPFPLGEGLTSILVKTRQPLMIVANTVERSRELGAKVVGEPAKSWLGVPLLVGGDVIGAMVVQDLVHEYRFDEDDQQLLMTLASQVGIAIRNARLLEDTQRQAERQRLLFEISDKIRRATDIETVLKITAEELKRALGAHQANIEIAIEEEL